MSTELKLPRNLVTMKKRMDFEAVNDADGEQLVSSLDHSVFFTGQLPLAPQDMQRILANLQSLGQPFAGLPSCPVPLKMEKGQKTSLDCPTGTQNLKKSDIFDSCSRIDQSIHGSLSTLRTYMKSARPFTTLSTSPASIDSCCAGKELQENLDAKPEEEDLRRMFSKLKIPPQDANVYFSGHIITCTSHECNQDRDSHIDGLQISDDKDLPKENAKHIIKSSPKDQGHPTHQRTRDLDYESVNKGDIKNEHSEDHVPAASLYKFSIRNHSQVNLNPSLLSSQSASKQTFEQAGTGFTNETLSNIRKVINFRHTDSSEEMLREIPADISAKLSSFSAQSLALSIGHASTVHSLTDKDDENSDSSTPTNQPSSPMAESPLTYSLHSAVDVCDRKGESKTVVSSKSHERLFCSKEKSRMDLVAPSVMSTPSKRDSPLYASLHPSLLCINQPIIKGSAPLDVYALGESEKKSSQSSVFAKSGRGEILPPDTTNRTDSDGCVMGRNVHSSLSVSQQSRPVSSCQIVNEMCTTLDGKKRWNQTSGEEPRSKMACHQLKDQLPPFTKSSSIKDVSKMKNDNHNNDVVHCNSANDLDVTGTWDGENLVSASCFKHSVSAFPSFAAVSLCHCGAMHSKVLSEHNQKNTAKSQNPHEGLEHFKGVEQMNSHLSACPLSSSASKHCGVVNYLQSAENSESLESKVGSNLSDWDSCSLLDPFKGGHEGGGFQQETLPQGNFCKHAFSTGADVSFQRPVFSLPSCDDLLQDTNSQASSDAIARFKKHFQDEGCNSDQTSDQIWSCDGSLDEKDIEDHAQQHKTSLCEQARERSSEHSFPVRAKSTPNFASSCTKSQLSEEKENTSLDLVTRGRLASRDKVSYIF